MLQRDVKVYVKDCEVCLASKAVHHKQYKNLQSLLIPTHWWKDLSMDFVTGLPILANWKGDTSDLILIIVNQLTKIGHYEPVKVTIDVLGLAEVIINIVGCHHGVPESIVMDWDSLFTLKFWSSLYYFLGIKKKLSTIFYPQTNSQAERQNCTMEAYLRAFVYWEQDDWVKLLPMTEFAYNNAKNANTGHIPFELNCGYHPRVSFKKDVDPRLRSRFTNKLAKELGELIKVCC